MIDTGVTIDPNLVQRVIEQAVEDNITKLVNDLCADPAWTSRVERLINQATVQETMARLSAIDIGPTIKQRVDENMKLFTDSILINFTSTGIVDQATTCQLTVMDETVVVENCLTAHSVEIINSAKVKDLVVTGSINTDNHSWTALANNISQRTLDQLTAEWNKDLVDQVTKQIQQHGIDFDQINLDGKPLISGNQLSSAITESRLQSVGVLKTLQVSGETQLNNNTVNVLNKRLGVNTTAPEMALSVWDEEVSIVVGKNRANEAYIGTNRDQSVAIGVNRETQIHIDTSGLTTVKKLQVGLHKISHADQVPGWSGTKGDIVFNSNLSPDRVFAWVCLGAHRWQTLKAAE
jgi:hypothetical protein